MFPFFAASTQFAEFKHGNFFTVPALARAIRSCAFQKLGSAVTGCVQRRRSMSLGTILLIILILLLVGALPTWPYSGGWGYYPSGGLGLVLVIVLILLLLGRI
jgi:hypothetical protein